ncbi:MAG: hypothetical protein ACTSVC_02465, partial [Promethearchaeota archaeon]
MNNRDIHAIGTTGQEVESDSNIRMSLIRIKATIFFETRRTLKKFMILLIIMLAFFILALTSNLLQEAKGSPLPSSSAEYFKGYLGSITLLIYIISSAFAGPIFAADFEKKTGYILFPKISRGELFIGRIISLYLLSAIIITLNYIFITIITYAKYSNLPGGLIPSLIFALLYLLACFSFTSLFSSFMKSVAFSIIISLIFLFIGFSMIEGIVMFTTNIEPLFSLSYLGNIILNIFNMPDPRYMEMKIPLNDGSGTVLKFTQWLTPTPESALLM